MTDYNIFLCYRGDKGGVLGSTIYSDLNAHGNSILKPFFAPRCIKQGYNFKDICIEVAEKVSLMIIILTPNFFDECVEDDDIVYQEIKAALKNENVKFLPIIMPDFSFKEQKLSHLFTEIEIDRIKHISAIQFNDVYSFSSSEMLIPILKDKMDLTDYESIIEEDVKKRGKSARERLHITNKDKYGYFAESNVAEMRRLVSQQKLLYKFDMPVYRKCLENKENINLLDIGCGNGEALMARFGNCDKIDKIIGIEFDDAAVKRAREKYSNDKVRFYTCDVESEDFEDILEKILEENEIEEFNFVNILATLSHLKSPYKVLKRVKKYCSKGTTIFIRNIDDGLNIAYPDENYDFERALNLLQKCATAGYRKSGREIYTILRRLGTQEITLERSGLNNINMDTDEKAAFFDVIFKFVKQGINKAVIDNPSDKMLKVECEWFNDIYDSLEERFQNNDFFFSFGFIIFTGILK